MSREIDKDYGYLEQFVVSYQLADIIQEELVKQLKSMHKKLFSLMTITAEIEHKNKTHKILTSEGLIYLKESVSDLGQALFCWIHGAYKPASLILRSGIETFIRALICREVPDILNEKSMYKVFDIAKETSFFSSEPGNYYLNKIHYKYRELCKVVHSAEQSKMSHICALKTFPIFSIDKASLVEQDVVNVLTMMLSIMYVCFFSFIYKMHPKNQINFFCTIPKSTKKKINDLLG